MSAALLAAEHSRGSVAMFRRMLDGGHSSIFNPDPDPDPDPEKRGGYGFVSG
jgi:hypothetical protein